MRAGGDDADAPDRRIAQYGEDLEQALVAAEDAREEAHRHAAEAERLDRLLAERDHVILELRRRLALVEGDAVERRREAERTSRRRAVERHGDEALTEELYAAYEELRILADELGESNAALEERVADRTAALRQAVEEAERANRAKTRFLAAASHDLRQPVQAAMLYADVLSRKLAGGGAAEVADLLRASLDNMSGMLNGLLDLSRLEAGAVEAAVVDFAPDELMLRLAAEFQGKAEAANVELRCLPLAGGVATDPQLLERILRNLLANAITHGRHDGSGRVLLAARRRGGMIEFQVRDNGPGIPAGDLDSVFEEFRQIGNPERNAAQGFGLGLAIVARIVRLLGLRLEVRSAEGRGSVFGVVVPPARAEPAPLPDPALEVGRMAATLAGRDGLVVEDDDAVRLAIGLLLREWGMQVTAARTLADLMRVMGTLKTAPCVLVTDYRLPGGITGDAVVALVRSRWDVPAIILTGDTSPERLRRAQATGCRLLHKPVDPAALARALAEVAGAAQGSEAPKA